MCERLYRKSCPNCSLSYSQWLRSIQIIFRKRFGFFPRDQQIRSCGSYDVYLEGNLYVHGSVCLGGFVYEFEFMPILTKLNTPQFGTFIKVDTVYDWVLELVWISDN